MGKATATHSSNATSGVHPPYFEMISDAILKLKDRTGSSQQAISKLIEEKYKKVLPPNFRKTLSVQLKKFVNSDRLIKVKNSYKISSAEKQKMAGEASRPKKGSPPRGKDEKRRPQKSGMKTKRLSQVKTPERLKNAGKSGKRKVAVTGGKTKRLSQVKTPDGLKKKGLTPLKRKNLNMGRSPAKKVRK